MLWLGWDMQINQARGLAETAFTSWPGNGKTQSFSLLLVATPRGSAGSIHQHYPKQFPKPSGRENSC